MISSSRRGFLRGLAGVSLLSAGGCFTPHPRKPGQKVRLAAVGIMGKGYSDWTPMLKTGLVEMVAFCDADANMLTQALERAKKDFPGLDLSKVPFYTDYRKLLDDADKLGIDAMTISTPDHVHAPVAIQAMKKGIHVYVQKPLVRTLWELDYFNKTARENGVVVQMGNQGSSLDSMRRCTEVLQSGILGDVTEVHVWTNRPVWPQGKGVADWVKGHPKGDPIRKGLDWNAWLATAADRPFLDQYPKDADVYDPWNLGKNVYHTFTWRGFFDFGAGAFGDMACHTMNLAFRGLELGGVSDAECTKIISENDVDLTVDYGVPAENLALEVDFGKGADKSVPDQLQDIVDMAADKGVTINGMVCARSVLSKMRQNPAVQKAINGLYMEGVLVTQAALLSFLESEYGITRVVINDQSYSTPWEVGADGRPVTHSTRYFPKNKVSFFGTGNGMRLGSGLWGIPPEEQIARFGVETGSSALNPYVYVTQWAEKDPAVVWTKASGLFMPVLFNPYSLYVATVQETPGA